MVKIIKSFSGKSVVDVVETEPVPDRRCEFRITVIERQEALELPEELFEDELNLILWADDWRRGSEFRMLVGQEADRLGLTERETKEEVWLILHLRERRRQEVCCCRPT